MSTSLGSNWRIVRATFGAREILDITGLPQTMLRSWRKRGHLPEKGKGSWAKHDAQEMLEIYVLNAFSKVGISPSDATPHLAGVATDLLYFSVLAGDGACDFVGPPQEVDTLRRRFDESFDLARQIIQPLDERRFLISSGGQLFERCADLTSLIEAERSEYFSCIDLVAAGRGIVERCKRPLLSFIFEPDGAEFPRVRKLSHGQREG